MIPSLPFGRTGHISTRVLFGAAALSRVTQAEADKAVETLMKYGVNHIDTSESYGDSELLLGPWMAKYRDKQNCMYWWRRGRVELRSSIIAAKLYPVTV